MNSNSSCLNTQEALAKIKLYRETGCNEAATALLLHFEPIVKIAAGKMSQSRPDLYEDLYQVGQLSLLKLFKNYDSDREIPFEGYAMKSIIGHLKNYLRDKSWYIQVPRRMKEKGLLAQQAIDHLTVELGHSPKIEDIASRLELSAEETIEVLSCRESYHYLSLDTPLTGTGESSATIGDLIGTDKDEYENVVNQLDLTEAMEQLKEEERRVLILAYHDGKSQRDIAEELGVSQMSVSRIQKRAIGKLKLLMNDD